MPTVLVHSRHRHPRLRYALSVLGEHVGYRFELTTEGRAETAKRAVPELWLYNADDSVPCLPVHDFLSGHAPPASHLVVDQRDGIPTFFAHPGSPLGYDPLSCIFFAVSRYEEYDNPAADAHGRFPGAASHAAINGYLHLPVVHHWASRVVNYLRRHYPGLPLPDPGPAYFQPTYDIDLLWAYRFRGARGVASGIRDLFTGEHRRFRTRFFSAPANDPYQTLDRLRGLHADRQDIRPRVFWLLSDGEHRHDPNPHPIPKAQIAWMENVAEWADVGLHPSYASSGRPELIREEAERFAAIYGRRPIHSRQHYLRFRLPDTYRHLRDAGIQHDHTMGYASLPGWRAGTNRRFRWYDLEREEVTGFYVHPFCVMDATLRKYLNLDAGEAFPTILGLYRSVEPFGGPVTLLWHNSSFAADYGWEGWWPAYRMLFQK